MKQNVRSKIVILLLFFLVTTSVFAQPDKRIGIVYSEPSANQFYDKFAYSQLYMAMQHQARMAGIPYDLLSEDDLTSITNLTAYDALIIPSMQYVTASKLSAIEATLNQAVFNYGIGLVVSGNLMTNSESGGQLAGDAYSRMKQWLGVSYADSASGVAMKIRANDISHPVMRDYSAGELILNYDQIWFDSFQSVAGQSANVLATLEVGAQSYNGVIATQTGGHNVHFANYQLLGDTNLVWSSLQWVVYGDELPVGLKLSRQNSIFIARNDMDSSMYPSLLSTNIIPLYNLLTDWKTEFNFVGSYYINIGNDPASGMYNWGISGPVFSDYISLGNEIGTHSWTHPFYTSNLSSIELEFEFNQSRMEIGSRLGIDVIGAAIPGNPESLAVDQQIEAYFDYVSGRSGVVGDGYPGAIGRMWPGANMIYFSLNMSPDYTLIEYLGHSSSEAELIWQDEYYGILRHASQPVIHWMWHDYGPVSGGNNYSLAMYANTIAMAHANGSEFVTLADLYDRINAHEAATLTVTGANPVTASVNANGVGQFSLMVQSDQIISQVDNWYAYDDDQIFLPDDGGQFIFQMGDNQVDVTRITALPMRARLMTLSGNGTELAFSFEGAGTVSVHLNPALAADLSVEGSDGFTQIGNHLSLYFGSNIGLHTVNLVQGSGSNQPPVANDQAVSLPQDSSIAITLTASDPEGNPLTFSIDTGPSQGQGQLSGVVPNLTYTPAPGFSGNDSFTFIANDGGFNSNIATVSISITANDGSISNPAPGLTVDGDLSDWSGLASFGPDPNDVSGTSNLLDWLEGWLAHDDTNLYLAFRNDGPISLSWGHNLYLDTDGNADTGFHYGGLYAIGADYLIQLGDLYQYTGNGSSWSWQYIGALTTVVSGNQAEFSLPRAWIGSPTNLRLFFLGENVAYSGGTTEDYYPDDVTNTTANIRFFSYSF